MKFSKSYYYTMVVCFWGSGEGKGDILKCKSPFGVDKTA